MRTRLVYVGHHKCGTGWIKRILRDVSAASGSKVSQEGYGRKDRAEEYSEELFDIVLWPNFFRHLYPIDKVNCHILHVIRDPRDMLISQYFSHRDTHPDRDWLAREREVLQRLDVRAGMSYLIRESPLFRSTVEELIAWDYARRCTIESRFEEITLEPLPVFQQVFDSARLNISTSVLQQVLAANSFANCKVRNPGHYRDGSIGQWTSRLCREQNEFFAAEFPGVVEKLGYSWEGLF